MIITKIFHVADVHIRTIKRHDEYERVFQRLFEYIKEKKDDGSVIVLAGDIVHSKTDMSPELVEMTSNFLRRCADLLPTILICGNHDANLSNSNRLDALSPIVNALNHPELIYLKNSGVKKIGGINFSVLSILDDESNWSLGKDVEKPSIALYHGPTWGLKNEYGFDIGQSGVDLATFDGYDYTLLGDIHIHSYLNENKTVAYPGSLICQNYGEHPIDHGIIVWDLETGTSEYVRIQNDYAYVTFDLKSGECDIPAGYPPNLRVRIRYENTTESQLQDFIRRLSKEYNIVELIKQKVQTNDSVSLNRDSLLINSRDIDDQNRIISDYLRSFDPNISDDDLIEITKLNREINGDVNTNPVLRNVTWKLKKLEFSNMFSYGKNNVIDFEKLSGCYGIFAANASGKSNLLNILSFVLYDKTPITSKSSHILNNRNDKFKCKLNFELNGFDYFIERIGSKKKDGNVRVDVDFWMIDDAGKKVNLNGEDRDKTNYAIRDYVGQYDDFVMTALSTQYDNQSFVEKTQRERKELLYKFMDIKIYDELYRVAKEKSKEFLTLIKSFEGEKLHNKSAELTNKISGLDVIVNSLHSDIENSRVVITSKTDELVELNKQLIPIDEELNVDYIEVNLSQSDQNLSEYTEQLVQIKSLIVDGKKLLMRASKGITAPESDAAVLRSDRIGYQNKLDDFKRRLYGLERDLQQCLEKEGHLGKHEYDPNCQYCVNNQFVVDAQMATRRIPELKQQIIRLQIEISDMAGEIGLIDLELGKWDDYNGKVSKINKLESDLNLYTERKNTTIYKIKNVKNQIKSLQSKKSKYEKNQRTIESNLRLLQECDRIKAEINRLQAEQVERQDKYKLAFSELERVNTEYGIVLGQLEKYVECVNKYRIYDLYLTAASRDGVPYKILEMILPVIESEVNNILQSIVNFTVKIESTDEKYVYAHIVYGDDKSWPVELTSGMERFILSLAFRVALSEITSLPKSNFLAIDEGFGVLDSDNLLSIGKLFDYLKGQYEYLLVISHIDSMKDLVDRQINIGKFEGYSKINV